jgi:hypothetical protein
MKVKARGRCAAWTCDAREERKAVADCQFLVLEMRNLR